MQVGISSQLTTLSLLFLPLHAFPLLQHGVHPTGYSPSETSPVLILPTENSPLGTNCSEVQPEEPSLAWILSHRAQFLPGICSPVGFPWATVALRAHPPPLLQGPSWAAGGQCAAPESFPWAARESVLQCLEHILPLLLH